MTFLNSRNRFPFTPIETAIWLLALVSLSFSFYATSLGFHNTLFDFHGFRQAQTAISAESILHGGSFLRYETPVFGPPWSVALRVPALPGRSRRPREDSSPLRLTRPVVFVSILFYYLCFFPLASILSSIGLRGTQMVPSLALFAMSPLYVFVSRLFLIESTALFFSLLYADQMFRLVLGQRRWQARHIAGGAVFGVLAGLVKVTTFAPFFVLGTSLAAWGLWKDRERGKLRVDILLEVTRVLSCASRRSDLGVDQVCGRGKGTKPDRHLPDKQRAPIRGTSERSPSDSTLESIFSSWTPLTTT